VTIEAAREVARRSRGTPRDAIRLLESARDIAQVSATAQVSAMSQVATMSQVKEGAEAKLAHVGQMHSLSPDAARAQIPDPAKACEMTTPTYDNAEAALGGENAAESAASLAPAIRAAHVVEAAHVKEAARRAGIDKRGLTREERSIVRLLLRRGKPTGLEAIASRLGLDLETLRDVHEPWLERAGLVERTMHGRVATERARAWYGPPLSKKLPGPAAEGGEGEREEKGEQKLEGQSEKKGQAGQGGGRRSIPILRLPLRFG